MRTRNVKTSFPIADVEMEAAHGFYDNTDEQPPTYDSGVPPYADFVAGVVASTEARSVLEFGCNAGRNLDLIRQRLPQATLLGVDLNRKMIEFGRGRYNLDLRVCDETGLAAMPTQAHDVAFTVSVVDHIPYPEFTLRHLLRTTRHYLILFEISSGVVGKAETVVMDDGLLGAPADSYPFSYLHDYRAECERKFGALCVADIQCPIQAGNMFDLYRMFVFTPHRELLDQRLVTALALQPLG